MAPRKKHDIPYTIGQEVEILGTVSFAYEIPMEVLAERGYDLKPRAGDKRVATPHPRKTPLRAFITGVTYRSVGTLSSYNDSSYEEPSETGFYLTITDTLPCVLFRETIRSKERMALLTQVRPIIKGTPSGNILSASSASPAAKALDAHIGRCGMVHSTSSEARKDASSEASG